MDATTTTGTTGTGDRWGRLGPAAVAVVALGLLAAIAGDGWLPAAWTQALLVALLPADAVAAVWLTRPRGA
jgi:hypothetical protein